MHRLKDSSSLWVQLTVAFSMASHSAAWALVYGSLPTGRYQIAAHFSRAAALAGKDAHFLQPSFPMHSRIAVP